jgi:hypothetical protein
VFNPVIDANQNIVHNEETIIDFSVYSKLYGDSLLKQCINQGRPLRRATAKKDLAGINKVHADIIEHVVCHWMNLLLV